MSDGEIAHERFAAGYRRIALRRGSARLDKAVSQTVLFAPA
jgi:hypothetical protein